MMSWAAASLLAEGLVGSMRPACERIGVAGSIRRRKAHVKDIELVVTPRYTEEGGGGGQLALPGSRVGVNALERLVGGWLEEGRAKARLDKRGRAALGPSYKRLLVSLGEQQPAATAWTAVDLFIVNPPAQWGLIYLIRTGSGVGGDGRPETGFGPAMLALWKRRTNGGYSKGGLLHRADGTPVETLEEQDVFEACGLPWIPPTERSDAWVVARYATIGSMA